MKISIAVSIIILAVGMAAGLWQRGRLTDLRDDRRDLVARAGELGLTFDAADSAEPTRATKRQRQIRDPQVKALAAEVAAFAAEMETRDDENGEDSKARGLALMDRMARLGADGIAEIIAVLRDDPVISDEMRENMIGSSLLMLAEKDSAAALALFSENAGLLDQGTMGGIVVSTALSNWARLDPLAALAWTRANPASVDEDDLEMLLAGASKADPRLAFKLIGEMEIDDPSSAIGTLVDEVETPEQRIAVLAALRDHLATVTDADERAALMEESLETMARNLSDEKFDDVAAWLATSRLTPEENAGFAAGISYFTTQEETGRWIGWMEKNLPAEDLADNVDNLVGQWTQQDYLAAGTWLASAPDGPGKAAAVSSYAATVAEYEPATAVQWALTLPPGETRQQTLESIYHNWPPSDARGAAEFAAKHGVGPGR